LLSLSLYLGEVLTLLAFLILLGGFLLLSPVLFGLF